MLFNGFANLLRYVYDLADSFRDLFYFFQPAYGVGSLFQLLRELDRFLTRAGNPFESFGERTGPWHKRQRYLEKLHGQTAILIELLRGMVFKLLQAGLLSLDEMLLDVLPDIEESVQVLESVCVCWVRLSANTG